MSQANIQFSTLLSNAVEQPGIISEAYSAFHNYSLGNVMAAAFQCAARGIQLGPIASYKAWMDKCRQVKKGEKAIALCMPITMKGEKENKSTGESEEYVYLEEDADLTLFVNTMKAQGRGVEFVGRSSNKLSRIRSYQSFRAEGVAA